MRNRLAAVALAFICGPAIASGAEPMWEQRLKDFVRVSGHRNWIVVADSAYPAQSGAGIETVVSGASQGEVARAVFAALSSARHVRPVVYTDQELSEIPETDAPRISAFRDELAHLSRGQDVLRCPHDRIIAKLDEAGRTFRVLVIKTESTLPYTSLFLYLECAYWNAEAEQRLRARIGSEVSR